VYCKFPKVLSPLPILKCQDQHPELQHLQFLSRVAELEKPRIWSRVESTH
jgi:hypothetical protein